ncbi:MAG: DNA (cytosine-5-)-methyltransferase [Campylobacterales bacterium]|nr:DNA (cytosine-5-)-methyltransferase [Campylobacterales bacterium]
MRTPNMFTYQNRADEHNSMTQATTQVTNIIKTVELFAGVGGFRIGLENANTKQSQFKVVWSNQWEPSTKTQHASDIYAQRFGEENHSNEDIATVAAEDIPHHDLLVGGFPCQDYSVASTLKNSHGIVGKKGVLWWEIYRILEQKGQNAPKYLMLENVDRLLKSPASQRGKDFAIILASLNNLGYGVEWRVINASDYGMPQRRRRIFILAYKEGTKLYNTFTQNTPSDLCNHAGIFAKAFPIEAIEQQSFIHNKLSDDLVDITQNFNKNTPKENQFFEMGYMVGGEYYTSKYQPKYSGKTTTLAEILIDETDVPQEFYIDEEALEKWRYQKGAKSIERVNKTTGHKYLYSEGGMTFPDALDKPSRTIITGEGGAAASRFKHVVCIDGRYRRLTPVELERLNMFPDNHTLGVTDSKRAFLMGNALVVGIVEQLGKVLLKSIEIK